MRVTGLFGWVAHNNARSAAFLIGFALLTQPMSMVVLFVPLVFLDAAHAPWYHWAGYGARYTPLVALAAFAYFVVQMRRHVSDVRDDAAFRIVDKTSEPRLCGLVEPLAVIAGLSALRVGVVESSAMNAFACGVAKRSSVVVFTRGLIDGLDDDELSAVVAHELVHIRNGDTRLIAAANVFMRSMLILDRANLLKPKRYRQIAILLLAPILFPIYLGVALLAQLCVRLGYASRLLISAAREFVADAEAVRLTQDPGALVSALRRIEGNSLIAGLPPAQDAMMIAGAAQGALAAHPRIVERIEAIIAVTGAMALDARPRRDTRSDFQKQCAARGGEVTRGAWTPNEARRLARIAINAAAPKQSGLAAFLRVGEGGDLSVFGLRWDMAAAMLATFCTAMIMNHGDIVGFMGRMSHALDRPGVHKQAIIDTAFACRNASVGLLLGGKDGKAAADACTPTPDWIAHAGALGIHLLGDGRLLNDSQLAMLSPNEIAEANAQPFDPAPLLHQRKTRPATDLAPSYPLPLHEAWLRLARGDLRRYLQGSQCGVLIHAYVASELDRSVAWSITSEGEERVRFTATLEPLGAQATRVSLAVDDRQQHTRIYDADKKDASGVIIKDYVGEPVVFHPALATPLRTTFSEAMSAMLEERLFHADRVWNDGAWQPGDGMTAGFCMNQRDRLQMSSEHFSIHDPEQP